MSRPARLRTLRREAPLLVAAAALVVALWLPPLPATRAVHRYEVTFDLSQSMGVEDVAVDGTSTSRLELAKAAARSLLVALPCGSQVGWSAFAERRTLTLMTPLDVCAHYDALLSALELVDGRMRWGEASGVGKGLYQSLRAASEIGGGTAVVLFSDGEEAPPLGSGQSGLPKGDELDVGGLLVGVGGYRPAPIPRVDEEGRQVGWWQMADITRGATGELLSRLDEPHLVELARLAGLGYMRLVEPGDLFAALDAAGLARTARVPTNFRWLPAALALLALGWRFRPDGLFPSRSGTRHPRAGRRAGVRGRGHSSRRAEPV